METVSPDLPADEEVFSVSELNSAIRSTLQGSFGRVWVAGEISDLSRPQSGHLYLALKDGDSQIRAVAWRSVASRLQFDLDDGMEVVCEGYIDVYPPRGTYQLIIRQVRPLGIGALQLALNQLREKLAAEGLFDARWKRPLPVYPRHIAVVTSPTGAAVRDYLEVIRRRWPLVRITVVPTRVQGAEAAEEIVQAMQMAEQLGPDVIVLTRGGGSLEDLWCFNDERVVRAIHQCQIPVVSAVGHEIDVTLSDLVADVRALTPTEAGERTVPSRDELIEAIRRMRERLSAMMRHRIDATRASLQSIESRPCLARPWQRMLDHRRRLDEWQDRMRRGIDRQVQSAADRVARLTGKLDSLSPLAVLARGYSVTTRESDGGLVRTVGDVAVGDRILTRTDQARITSRVEKAESAEFEIGGETIGTSGQTE